MENVNLLCGSIYDLFFEMIEMCKKADEVILYKSIHWGLTVQALSFLFISSQAAFVVKIEFFTKRLQFWN